MIYEVAAAGPIDLFASEEKVAILQCIRMIVTTYKGSVPLYREFGSAYPVDSPVDKAIAKANAEIVDQISRYEPRVKVLGVDWTKSELEQGKLVPVLRLVLP
jgi:uncharacterized protein